MKAPKPEAAPCFECHGAGVCACILCGHETRLGFVAGPCVPCAGRALYAAFYAAYPDCNPYDYRQRRLIRHEAPAKPEWRLIAMEEFREKL